MVFSEQEYFLLFLETDVEGEGENKDEGESEGTGDCRQRVVELADLSKYKRTEKKG